MKKKTIATALILTMGLVLVAGPASAWSFGKGVKGSGDLETRSFDLDSFDQIRIDGGFDLEITMGDEQIVRITIDDNLWDLLEAEVEDGTLELDWKKSCRPNGDCKINLVMRQLEKIKINGAGDVEIEDFQGKSFDFVCNGAGDLTMDGQVDELKIRISGAGDVDTRHLEAKRVDVSISGAGNAEVRASRFLKGRISGVGNLEYYGDPDEKDTRVSGIGHIHKH